MSRQRRGLTALAVLVFSVVVLTAAAVTVGEVESDRARSQLKKVTFTFEPHAPFANVFLAGTFNGWSTDATPMERMDDRFEVTLYLPVGQYQYKFVADGQWITDEQALAFHPDGYGGQNSVIVVDESFESIEVARGDSHITIEDLTHKQSAWELSLGTDGTVTVRVRTWMGDVEAVELCWSGEADLPLGGVPAVTFQCDSMYLFDTDGTYDYYEARLDLARFAYCFRLHDGDAQASIDAQGAHEGAPSEVRPFAFNAVEVAAFATPDWVKEGIIYQIFPERFANGDKSNDPNFGEWYYEGLTTLPPSGKTNGEYFHLVDDWYDVTGLQVSPYKTDGKPDWNSFYGGDIAGLEQKLDYLADLGITIIYFNPVFMAKSNHKYDAATYTQIDPHFGTNEEFKDFVAACHSRGIRIVLDLAINHTGHTYWAFVDAREKGSESRYWDWYEWKSWPVPGDKVNTPHNASDYYDCWWNFGQMPNLNFDLGRANAEEQNIVDIDAAQPNWSMVNHLLDAAEFWLAQIGVDGYRLDVAADVPFWFWELFRERVKATKPDAYIVGELWGESSQWINGRYFDATMNYKFFRDPVWAFIAKGEIDAAEFDRTLAQGRLIYPEEGVRAMMNLIDSHDTERFLDVAREDVRRLKLQALFAMTYMGAPTVYYGDEIAMTGGGDPDCRRPFHWKWQEEPRRVAVHDYYRRLIALRKAHPCFAWGSFRTLVADGKVYAYRRKSAADEALVVMNAGLTDVSVELPAGHDVPVVKDALRDTLIPTELRGEGLAFTVSLPALSGTVILPMAE